MPSILDRRNLILLLIIVIEIFVIVYLLFHESLFSIKEKTQKYYFTDCIISPFTQKVIECIDRTKENVTPRYSCKFLVFNKSSKRRVYLMPNFSQLFDGCTYRLPKITTVTINSYGFRDYEPRRNKTTIVALGSSITFGWGVELNQSWPKILERMIKEKNDKVQVLNLGLPTSNMVEKFEFFYEVGSVFKPKLILLEYNGYQDFINYSHILELKTNKKFTENLMKDFKGTKNEYEEELTKRLYSFEVKFSRRPDVFETRFKNMFERNVIKLHNLTKDDIVVIFFVGGYEDEKKLEELDRNYSWLHFINVRKYLASFDQKQLVLRSLDFHPSAQAYKLAARYIYNKIMENNRTRNAILS